jgi:hypothetical protein
MVSIKTPITVTIPISKMNFYLLVFAIKSCIRLLLTENFEKLYLVIRQMHFYTLHFRPVIFLVTALLGSCSSLLFRCFYFMTKRKKNITINKLIKSLKEFYMHPILPPSTVRLMPFT